MAKHAKPNGNTGMPLQGENGYVYPNGRRYGADHNSSAQQPTQVYHPVAYNQIPHNRDTFEPIEYTAATDFSTAYKQSLPKKKKKKGVLKGIAAFLAVLVVIFGAGLLYFVMQVDKGLGYDDSNYASNVIERLAAQKDNDVFYTLIIGSDQPLSSTASNVKARSDVLILARVDTKKNTVTLVSIPRDTPWRQPTGEYLKINEAYYMGGANSSLDAVEELTGVGINHVMEVRLNKLASYIDSIGGLEYDVPVTIHHIDKDAGEDYYIEAGNQVLSGKDATILIRARHDYGENQEANRQNTIRGVVIALFRQTMSRPVPELPGTLVNATQCIDTDMNSAQLFFTATGLGPDAKFYTVSGPTDGGADPGYDGRWYCYLNPTGWERLMATVDVGEDPSSVSYENDVVYYPSTGEPVY